MHTGAPHAQRLIPFALTACAHGSPCHRGMKGPGSRKPAREQLESFIESFVDQVWSGESEADSETTIMPQRLTVRHCGVAYSLVVADAVHTRHTGNPDLGTLFPTCLQTGELVEGVVLKVKPLGAFVDIGGWRTALLPVSLISTAYVEDIGSVLREGDRIRTLVVKCDTEDERYVVSTWELEPTP